MQRTSWILLSICVVLVGVLGFGYIASKNGEQALGRTQADAMLDNMKQAVSRKNVGTIMHYISDDPDVRLANMRQDQLRMLLARAFAGSGDINATTTNESFQSAGDEATMSFDLSVKNQLKDETSQATGMDYNGHVTLHLRRTDISHMFGLYHTPEWRIIGAEQSGRDLSSMMDFGF